MNQQLQYHLLVMDGSRSDKIGNGALFYQGCWDVLTCKNSFVSFVCLLFGRVAKYCGSCKKKPWSGKVGTFNWVFSPWKYSTMCKKKAYFLVRDNLPNRYLILEVTCQRKEDMYANGATTLPLAIIALALHQTFKRVVCEFLQCTNTHR